MLQALFTSSRNAAIDVILYITHKLKELAKSAINLNPRL